MDNHHRRSVNIYIDTHLNNSQGIFGNPSGGGLPNFDRTLSAPTSTDLTSGSSQESRPTPLPRARTDNQLFNGSTVQTVQVDTWDTPSAVIAIASREYRRPSSSTQEVEEITDEPGSDLEENADMPYNQQSQYNEYAKAIEIDDAALAWPQPILWYSKGKVFKIIEDKNNVLANRVFVALGLSRDNQLQCLALAEHRDIGDFQPRWWEVHALVHALPKGQEPEMLANNKNPIVRLELDAKRHLLGDVFLDLEQAYTVPIEKLKVLSCGKVTSDIGELVDLHTQVYCKMMKRDWHA
ncbi:hypothetical protein PGQ11_003664 [Apiospora arundinis]|uniref:Uncharacterized protein n=1 Tax=Apiospora arundinis TaxID=335852 RepID=A0ABR2J687_9PEZI